MDLGKFDPNKIKLYYKICKVSSENQTYFFSYGSRGRPLYLYNLQRKAPEIYSYGHLMEEWLR